MIKETKKLLILLFWKNYNRKIRLFLLKAKNKSYLSIVVQCNEFNKKSLTIHSINHSDTMNSIYVNDIKNSKILFINYKLFIHIHECMFPRTDQVSHY